MLPQRALGVAGICCPEGAICHGLGCCPKERACDRKCCAEGQYCADPAKGLCCSQDQELCNDSYYGPVCCYKGACTDNTHMGPEWQNKVHCCGRTKSEDGAWAPKACPYVGWDPGSGVPQYEACCDVPSGLPDGTCADCQMWRMA